MSKRLDYRGLTGNNPTWYVMPGGSLGTNFMLRPVNGAIFRTSGSIFFPCWAPLPSWSAQAPTRGRGHQHQG